MGAAILDIERGLAGVIGQAREAKQPSATCSRSRSGTGVRLEIWGALPPSWSGSLALHCAEVGLNVDRGLGCRVSPGQWAGRIELSSSRPIDAHAFDFLRMARAAAASSARAGLPQLESFELWRRSGSGLAAAVRGPDRPGFLAAVLQRFALFSLHPERFVLAGVGDLAVDHFVLEAAGGAIPSPQCAAALRSALTACLPPPSAPSARGVLPTGAL